MTASSGGVGRAWAALVDCLFPVACGACPTLGRAPFCVMCEGALEPAGPTELPGLGRVVAPYAYGGPAALALRALKYEGRLELGRPLGARVIDHHARLPAFDLLVPIPSSRSRLARRGYNPARELARGLGRPASPRVLVRVGERVPQVGLHRADRLVNQRGAFRADPGRVRGRRVLVVDDVISTGATLLAAREALLEAGARQVNAAAFARARPELEPVDGPE